MTDKQWLEDQIAKLTGELNEAAQRRKVMTEALDVVKLEHKHAVEAYATIRRCIKGLQDELDFIERSAGGGAGKV